MSAQPQPASNAQATGSFVINLCSSTTPMALSQAQIPELKRFTFFVSRRLEDGRERFRLHMGHFATLVEAEEWVNAVRDIYPGAWAGEAPGKRLAQKAAAAAAQGSATSSLAAVPNIEPPPAAHIEAAAPVLTQKPVTAFVKSTVATPAAPAAPAALMRNVPTLQAAVEPSVPTAPAVAPKVAATPAKIVTPAKAASAAPKPAAPAAAPATATVAATAPIATAPAAVKPAVTAASNIREVLKSLDDTATSTRPALPVKKPQAAPAASMTDTAVLKILEDRGAPAKNEESARGIEMLRPDDTATVRALKDAVRKNDAVAFAVQLQWSVQPIDLTKVPPLAILSAYTLYTVEGSRDGRKWYGLRLGFFNDAISAKQVASYVRSEFAAVAILPVSVQEKGRATQTDPAAAAARPRLHQERRPEEFKLLEDATDDVARLDMLEAQEKAKLAQIAAKAKAARVERRSPDRPFSRKKAIGKGSRENPLVKQLEETLEILGADDLEIDNGRGELLNDSGVRHLRIEVQKNSPFSRLIDRLTERVRKG